MFPKFYLKGYFLLLFSLGLLVSKVLGGNKLFSLALIILGSLLFLFRKNAPFFQDFLRRGQETYLAPIYGRVTNIFSSYIAQLGDTYNICLIKMPWNSEYGIYFPMNAEVLGLSKVDIKILEDERWQGELLTLENKELGCFYLFIFRESFLRRPRIYVRVGDRGKRGANLGYLPFGGKVALILPMNTEVFVRNSDIVDPLGTFVAGIKGSSI